MQITFFELDVGYLVPVQPLVSLLGTLSIVRMGGVKPTERGQFRGGVTEHAAESSVDLQNARVCLGYAQAERRILESHPETRFVIAQRLLGCLGLGNVVNDGSRTGDLPG